MLIAAQIAVDLGKDAEEPPKGMARPEGVEPPKGMARPEGMERPEGAGNFFGREEAAELSTDIVIVDGGNYFL